MLGEAASEPKSPSRSGASVTIQDIARALNISHTTVSRALADSPKISAETKLRVRNAVEQLGYVPSASARMMRSGSSPLVGLIIPDVQNDFYATVAKTVADCLAARSMQLLLSVTDDDSDRELRELRGILETRPAGIIIVPTAAARAETAALLKNVETVQLIRTHSHLSARAVIVDDRAGQTAANTNRWWITLRSSHGSAHFERPRTSAPGITRCYARAATHAFNSACAVFSARRLYSSAIGGV
jgi:LacI family transcriptional regulator